MQPSAVSPHRWQQVGCCIFVAEELFHGSLDRQTQQNIGGCSTVGLGPAKTSAAGCMQGGGSCWDQGQFSSVVHGVDRLPLCSAVHGALDAVPVAGDGLRREDHVERPRHCAASAPFPVCLTNMCHALDLKAEVDLFHLHVVWLTSRSMSPLRRRCCLYILCIGPTMMLM